MQSGKRKREVSSCIPCHTRKQKCDRQYPCNRCSRRRQPELCAYYSFHLQRQTSGLAAPSSEKGQVGNAEPSGADKNTMLDGEPEPDDESSATPGTPEKRLGWSSLAEAFGYDSRSECNTMALVRKLAPEDVGADARDKAIPTETEAQVRKALEAMPNRRIIDFLVRYFVAEVNWIDQLLYPPWFLAQYQRWWGLDSVSTVAEVEFILLILRICCYASQFLPSPAYTIDSVKGVPLGEVRKSCEEVIHVLGPICTRLDPRGSLVRVQHIAYGGLTAGSVGHMNSFWESVSCASRVAQHIGLHLDTVISASSTDEMDKEMRRRTYCNLYIWDSYLAKHLDRVAFLPDTLNADVLPRMRLLPDFIDLDSDSLDVPDMFTERIVRAQLAQFWRCHHLPRGPEWDVIDAVEKYEEFCSSYLQEIPSAFALQPDKQWDERLPRLPLQRQLLHIAIFEQFCWTFRPTLLQQPDQVSRLPLYKQVMMAYGKRALAAAALRLLECVSTLHRLMGGSHTRFSGIIVPTFEAAVPLLCLYADHRFPGDTIQHDRPPRGTSSRNTNPLEDRISNVTRGTCMQAARNALKTLETLAEVSEVAEVAARTLTRLIDKVGSLTPLSLEDQQAYWAVPGAGGADVCGNVAGQGSAGGGFWRFGVAGEDAQ